MILETFLKDNKENLQKKEENTKRNLTNCHQNPGSLRKKFNKLTIIIKSKFMKKNIYLKTII
jgi:chaperonin cofactor prefoldin